MSIFDDKYKNGIPGLITTRVDKDIDDYIDKNKVESVIHKTSYFVFNKVKIFVWENILVIIFIVGIIIFLFYRYYMKRSKEKEDFVNEDIDDTYDILQFHNKPFVRPTMNPIYPIKKQMNYALYPPEKMPYKTNGKTVNFIRDDQKVISSRDLREVGVPGQIHKYTYPNYGYHQSAGDCYAGLANPYQHSNNNPHLRSAYEYPTNFNETTGDFISTMTGLNRHTINTYYDILQNRENMLKHNLNMNK